MFGYVRPLREELKVREFDLYKAAYCGLCHCLKDQYGLAARFCVNYDLTFLAMLLSPPEAPDLCTRRCMASPFRKKSCCGQSPAMEQAAAVSLILCWWKLADMEQDGGLWDKVRAALGRLALRRAKKKAALNLPDFDAAVQQQLSALAQLEQEGCKSLDQVADCFAKLLQAAAPADAGPEQKRVLGQLLYHVGRWIYIVDAADDLKQDLEKGNYNPLAARFEIQEGRLPEEQKAWLEATMKHSASLAAAALELLPESRWSGILRNVLYLGMPLTAKQVLEGRYRAPKSKTPQ